MCPDHITDQSHARIRKKSFQAAGRTQLGCVCMYLIGWESRKQLHGNFHAVWESRLTKHCWDNARESHVKVHSRHCSRCCCQLIITEQFADHIICKYDLNCHKLKLTCRIFDLTKVWVAHSPPRPLIQVYSPLTDSLLQNSSCSLSQWGVCWVALKTMHSWGSHECH